MLATAPTYGVPVAVDPALVEILLSPTLHVGAFVWGLLWGSFANVVIHRLPNGMSVVTPRSRCGHCEAPIAWYDNVPVLSYIVLRGRCRQCKTRYGPRYLMVELLCGVISFALWSLFVITPLIEGQGAEGVWRWALWFFFSLALLIITFTDLDAWIIPNEVVLPMGAAGLVVAGVAPDLLGVPLQEAGIAAALGYGLILAIFFIYLKWRGIEAIGLGDGKLLFMVGAFTGLKGLVWTLGAGALQGLIVSVPLLLLGGTVANSTLEEAHGDDPALAEDEEDGVMGMHVPFGPFLALAALEYVLLHRQIENLWQWLLQGGPFL